MCRQVPLAGSWLVGSSLVLFRPLVGLSCRGYVSVCCFDADERLSGRRDDPGLVVL